MALDKISVSPSDYVVLDVETNGLRSKDHDLLSLSIYKPDDKKEFDRLFPLDLNSAVPREITAINGIKTSDLKKKKHLTQEEFDALVADYELDTRTILHYGDIDMRFVRDYLTRQGIEGFEKLNFFNFKKRICSSKFSSGNLTKDNLCRMFGIEGVKKIHSGLNDCKLEWELFKKIDGDFLLVTSGVLADNVFRLNEDYFVPASMLQSYPNLSKVFDRPYIVQESEVVFRHKIDGKTIERFETNFSGVTIEHLINTMLDVEEIDSSEFLLENKKKLQLLGKVSSFYDSVPISLNPDGSVTAHCEKDKELEARINRTNKVLKPELQSVVAFIKRGIFKDKPIKSQELIVDNDLRILALCDLSSEDAVLEIKTGKADLDRYAEQLYYESQGRDSYLLCFEWEDIESRLLYEHIGLDIVIYKVKPEIGVKPNKRRDNTIAKLNKKLKSINVTIEEYKSSSKPILLKCGVCGQLWQDRYGRIQYGSVACPVCHPDSACGKRVRDGNQKTVLTLKEKEKKRVDKFAKKVIERSSGTLTVDKESYIGSKDPVKVSCNVCGYRWIRRADHLLSKCYCPKCRKLSNKATL